MSTITHIGNFAISHGLIIFLVSLSIFLGRSLDKFVKKSSKATFARDFVRFQKLNYLNAARISLDGLDSVFKTRNIVGFKVPKLSRLYVVSVLISSTIMAYYLVISLNNYVLGSVVFGENGGSKFAIIFSTGESLEFMFLLLLPLLIFFSNPILDFFSYSQTRIFLNMLIKVLERGKYPALVVILFFCIADLAYSFILFVAFIYGTRAMFYNFTFEADSSSPKEPASFVETLEYLAREPFDLIGSYFSSLGVDGLYGGILLSTFISTLFVWYVYFSYFVSTIQKYFSRLLQYLNRHTYIMRIFYRKPFSIISYLISGVAVFIDILIKQLV